MLVLACDHGGYELMQSIKAHLDERGISYLDCGCDSPDSVDYPDYARKLAETVREDTDHLGILICGTGIGISIAANKIPGIRAALCSDCFSAEAAREHNNANVLVLGGRVVGPGLACRIVDAFLGAAFSGDERHVRRLQKITAIEEESYIVFPDLDSYPLG